MTTPQAVPIFEIPHSRWSDPATSREAANSISQEKLNQTQERVLSIVRIHGPVTDEEVIAHYRQLWPESRTSEQSIRSRRSELTKRGLILQAGKFGTTALGGKCRMWRAA